MKCIEIKYKFPSLNDYIRACRGNKFGGANMKKRIENDISWDIEKLPTFDKPVFIDFLWTEKNKRRDFDNIAFAKKFILDAMVKQGKLKDDNRRWVVGFSDRFKQGDFYSCTLLIREEGTR